MTRSTQAYVTIKVINSYCTIRLFRIFYRKMIVDLIFNSIDCVNRLRQDKPPSQQALTFPAGPLNQGIPTLKKDVHQEPSPMLTERYELFSRWMRATHGSWLSLADMEELWKETLPDDFLNRVSINRMAAEENWPNDAAALFRPERLSLFAGSDNGNERIYLLWPDFVEEPELWVYDSNGESRYKNLEDYLTAFLKDDLSASTRSWRA